MKYIIENMKQLLLTLLAVLLFANCSEKTNLTKAYDAEVNLDKKLAYDYFTLACMDGDSIGCYAAGEYNENGKAQGVNLYKALENYEKACKMGHRGACNDVPRLKANMPVCSEDELNSFTNERYFYVSGSERFPYILADSNTIQIDKKNKTIKVWTVSIANNLERQNTIKFFTKHQKVDNYGYMTSLRMINYGSFQTKLIEMIDKNCNGSTINSYNFSDEKWDNIQPGTVIDGMTQSIIKKYNLK